MTHDNIDYQLSQRLLLSITSNMEFKIVVKGISNEY